MASEEVSATSSGLKVLGSEYRQKRSSPPYCAPVPARAEQTMENTARKRFIAPLPPTIASGRDNSPQPASGSGAPTPPHPEPGRSRAGAAGFPTKAGDPLHRGREGPGWPPREYRSESTPGVAPSGSAARWAGRASPERDR